MKTKSVTLALGLAAILSLPFQPSSGADEVANNKPTAMEKLFSRRRLTTG
jgi:hypothetical protein